MRDTWRLRTHAPVHAWILFGACALACPTPAQEYHPINPTLANRTIILTGNDLTIDQVIQVARYGAKLEAQALDEFKNGSDESDEHGSEFMDEDAVRAMMVIRANQMTYLAASPGMMKGLIDLINADITPVMRSRAGTGEAQGPSAGAMNAAMVGAGEVSSHGVRMPASEALQGAMLKPIQPGPGDSTMGSVNSDVVGLAAILVEDAHRYLDWVDLAYAMDLNGMNSSITPLFMPVQVSRPYKWINWDAARVLDMLKGSYLFDDDKARIIQDPESMRAG